MTSSIKYNYPEMKNGKYLDMWILEQLRNIESSPRGLSHHKTICNKPKTFGHYVINYLEKLLR